MGMEFWVYFIFFIHNFSINFLHNSKLLCKYMYYIKMFYSLVFTVNLHFLIIEEGMTCYRTTKSVSHF